ncbi:hypothetical protein V8C44DRAFT_131456 [Trichoderma aethiopicum]
MRRRVVDADLLVLLVQRLRLAALDAGKQLVLNVGGQLDADRVGVVAVLVANVASVGPGRCLGLGRRAVVRGAVSPGGEEGCRLRVKIVSVPVAVGARREGAKGDVGREPGRGWRRNVGWLWGLISSSTRLQALKAERERDKRRGEGETEAIKRARFQLFVSAQAAPYSILDRWGRVTREDGLASISDGRTAVSMFCGQAA